MPVGASLSRSDPTVIELVIFLTIAAIAAVVGIRLGIVLIAPRISRALDRAEIDSEEPGDRPD
jgi:hypothetical protein